MMMVCLPTYLPTVGNQLVVRDGSFIRSFLSCFSIRRVRMASSMHCFPTTLHFVPYFDRAFAPQHFACLLACLSPYLLACLLACYSLVYAFI